ncbi:MAG TPA: S1C family serine protease [Polyangia bacterium]
MSSARWARRVALTVASLWLSGVAFAAPPEPSAPRCSGEYADDLQVLAPHALEYERQPYSYSVRNTASYECLSYGEGGTVRRTRKRAVMHGTAFGYRTLPATHETLLLTNEHIAEWPAVTDADHPVDGVPSGCKKLSDTLRIVDGEDDSYERDDVPLTRVVADPQLDVAVLKAHTLLHVLPWHIGRSAALKERNVVEVRGFPLGAFQATNVGKVVSALDHDNYHEWDHDDFVIDALLSSGNAGSPVLAVSCRTGEFELVGIYHAGYSEGSALNVVVGIDQLRDLMTTLKRSPHTHDGAVTLDARERARLADAHSPDAPYFPFGPLTAAVRVREGGALLFELMSRDFPLKTHPILVLEDLPPRSGDTSFGTLGRVWLGSAAGLKPYARADLDAEAQAQVVHLLDLLRRDAIATFRYRAAAAGAGSSRERFDQMKRLERALRRTSAQRHDPAQSAVELADRLAPRTGDPSVSLADLFAPPAPAPPPSRPEVTERH